MRAPALGVLLVIALAALANAQSDRVLVSVWAIERTALTGNNSMSRSEAQALIAANVDAAARQIARAAAAGASLVVLPEYTLFGPDYTRAGIEPLLDELPTDSALANSNVNPCARADARAFATTLLSCAARAAAVALVATVAERERCDARTGRSTAAAAAGAPCPPDGFFVYNTAVALSSTGQLVAKYRKLHLYYEPAFDTPSSWHAVRATIDVGGVPLSFGLLICYDLLFSDPAAGERASGVDAFVFPSFWVNEPPLLTLPAVLAGWSRARNATIVAAGTGVSWLSSGSGVFTAGETRVSWFNTSPRSVERTLGANVTMARARDGPVAPPEPFRFPPCGRPHAPQLARFVARAGASGAVAVTNGVTRCHVRWAVAADSPESGMVFALVAFTRCFSALMGAEVCGVVRCANATACLDTGLVASATVFDALELDALFSPAFVPLVIAAQSDGVPVPLEASALVDRGGGAFTLALTASVPVVSFSLFARPLRLNGTAV